MTKHRSDPSPAFGANLMAYTDAFIQVGIREPLYAPDELAMSTKFFMNCLTGGRK